MSTDLKKLLRIVRNADLIVSPRHEQWLLSHADDPLPKDVADLVYERLVTAPRSRSGSFAGSAGGQCLRRQIYAFLGVPSGDTIDPGLAAIFANGKWAHLRWQAQLLASGIIDQIEVPLGWKRMRDRGTMDGVGVVYDLHPKTHWRGLSFGLELKTANSFVYRKLMNDGPDKYERQIARYVLSGGWDLFVTIVENKDTQDYFEWVSEPNQTVIDNQRRELTILNDHVDQQQLPVMLAECRRHTGQVFRDCPFGGKTGPCVNINNWGSAVDAATSNTIS